MLGAMDKATPDKTATASDLVDDFLTSGRTGRRNALHDIMGEHAATSVADLPACLDKLSTHDASTSGASGSGASNPFGRTDPPATTTPPPAAPAPSPSPAAGKQQSPKKDKPKS